MNANIVCDFVFAKEIWSDVTSIYGTCKWARKTHTFQLLPKLDGSQILEELHKKRKGIAICNQLSVVGCDLSNKIWFF